MKTYPIKCQISNAGAVTRVDVYDDIGSDFFTAGISAADFAASLAPVKGALEVHINSGGGNVFDGVAIAEAVRSHKGKVTTIVDGVAASIASVIAQAGHERVMAPGSMLMIHDASGWCEGSAADMAKSAEVLGKVSDNLAEQYAKRAGGTKDQWRQAMLAESWYTAEEAVDAGLADRISDEGTAMWPASLDVAAFSSIPGRIAASLRRMPQAAEGGHVTMTGTHAHTHPAYGSQGGDATHSHEHSHDGDASHGHAHAAPASDSAGPLLNAGNGGWQQRDGKWVFDPDNDGDNDATASGDTDHDYWSADGTQLKSIPPDPDGKQGKPLAPNQKGNRSAFPILDADVDNSPWNAAKAWAAGAQADDPAAFYKAICAGRKAGDPATQAAWALPYKYSPSSPVNAAGVKNALARLPQTDGLTNADEAKATLEKAMKQVNPEYDPDGLIDPAKLRAALRLEAPGVDDSPWDAAVAWAMGAEYEDPAWYYSQICAGRRSGDPANQSSWALPYRYSPDSPPNSAGVRDCLARLPQASSLTNKAQARETLEAAMKKVDPDGSPDDHIDAELLSAAFANGLEGATR